MSGYYRSLCTIKWFNMERHKYGIMSVNCLIYTHNHLCALQFRKEKKGMNIWELTNSEYDRIKYL